MENRSIIAGELEGNKTRIEEAQQDNMRSTQENRRRQVGGEEEIRRKATGKKDGSRT